MCFYSNITWFLVLVPGHCSLVLGSFLLVPSSRFLISGSQVLVSCV